MDDSVLLILLILLIVTCECIAQCCANYNRHTGNIMYIFAGGLMYTLVVFILSKTHEITSMGTVNAIWSGLSILSVIAVGYLLFDQKISKDKLIAASLIALGVSYLAIHIEPTP